MQSPTSTTTLEAGRRLDVQVSACLGWKALGAWTTTDPDEEPQDNDWVGLPPGTGDGAIPEIVPYFSSRFDAARDLVYFLKRNRCSVARVYNKSTKQFKVTVYPPSYRTGQNFGVASTFAHALALAIVNAKGLQNVEEACEEKTVDESYIVHPMKEQKEQGK